MPLPIILTPLTEFIKNCAMRFPIIPSPLTEFIKVPHLRAHLNEEVDHGSRRSEDHLRVGGHHPAGHPITLLSQN
jgi:hypothetical protein